MILALILIPALAAAATLVIPSRPGRWAILILTAIAHTTITLTAWAIPPAPTLNGFLMLDGPGLLFLTLTSVLFLAAAFYGVGYLKAEQTNDRKRDFQEGTFFTNTPDTIFIACLLAFLTTMTLATVSQHLGLLWVAMEATTLASAPLIYYHRHHRSLEATWKYLLICSVGIALALLGNFFLVIAASQTGQSVSLLLSDLLQNATGFNVQWLKAAFLFFLVGYGTKMGLAPMHTWLPDAHSESPSVVSALLSGALLNCAFLGILRVHQICLAAGQAEFSRDLLVMFGLISIGWAAVFILGQRDYKRMLAYSSVEHMGILALGVGMGGVATFGAMLHAVNHSLTKAMLFMIAGNILAAYKTKNSADVRGVLRVLPVSGVLWVAGFLAITGVPPFGMFLSEFTIAKGILDGNHYGIAIAFLILLAIIFVGMSSAVLKMAQGKAPSLSTNPTQRETVLAVAPPMVLGILILVLGLYVPPILSQALHSVARTLGGF
jgi:hydrogenase-4 component F